MNIAELLRSFKAFEKNNDRPKKRVWLSHLAEPIIIPILIRSLP